MGLMRKGLTAGVSVRPMTASSRINKRLTLSTNDRLLYSLLQG